METWVFFLERKEERRKMKFLKEAKKMVWTKPVDLFKNLGIVLGFTVVVGCIVYGIDAVTVFLLYH